MTNECPTCGEPNVSISHIKTCRKLRAADPTELDEQRRLQFGDDWQHNQPFFAFESYADWRED